MFVGNTGTRADRAGETVDAINKEIRRMAENGPTQQELDEAKSYLKGSQMLALDTSSKLAAALLQYQLDRLPIDYIEKRNAIVDAVTLDDAKKAARRAVGPGSSHRRSSAALAQPPGRAGGPARRGATSGELHCSGRYQACTYPRTFRLRRRTAAAGTGPSANRAQNRYPALTPIPSGIMPGSVTPCCGFPATSRSTKTTSRSRSSARRARAGRTSTSSRPRRNCVSIPRRIALPADAEARLTRLAGQRMTKDGVIVIHAQRFRTQERNRADADRPAGRTVA